MKTLLIASAVLFLTACATQGKNTHSYVIGTKAPIINELTINAPYWLVWDALVRDLSKSFFVINNIDKESRLINVSLSSTEPQDYVNCGRTTRTYAEGANIDRYDYLVAARSTFKVATERQQHPSFSNYVAVTREPTLEGRANIYVAPASNDASKTSISVNTRYVLTMKVRGDSYAKYFSGNLHRTGRAFDESYVYSFNTNGQDIKDSNGDVPVTCFASGKLERELLQLYKGQ